MKEVSALSPTYEPIEWLKTFLIVKLFFKIKIKSPNIRWNLYIYINLYLLTFNYYNICFPSQSCIPIFFSYKSYRRPLLFANQLQCLLLLLLLIAPKVILYHPEEELKIFFLKWGTTFMKLHAWNAWQRCDHPEAMATVEAMEQMSSWEGRWLKGDIRKWWSEQEQGA